MVSKDGIVVVVHFLSLVEFEEKQGSHWAKTSLDLSCKVVSVFLEAR